MDIAELDTMIREAGQPRSAIERAAGLSAGYLWCVLSGRRALTDTMAARVKLAVRRLQRGDTNTDASAAAAYCLAVAYVARQFAVCPADVLASDPSRRATADAAWRTASKARRWALYIANIYMGIPGAQLARAAGMTKAAVSIALNAIEDERDNAEIEAMLADIDGAFSS